MHIYACMILVHVCCTGLGRKWGWSRKIWHDSVHPPNSSDGIPAFQSRFSNHTSSHLSTCLKGLIFNLQYFYCIQKNPRNSHVLRQFRGSPLPPHTPRFWENSLFPLPAPGESHRGVPPQPDPTRSPHGKGGRCPPAPASGPAACTGVCPPGSPAQGNRAGSGPRRCQPPPPPENRGRREI